MTMQVNKKLRIRLLLQNGVFIVLLLALAGLLGYLAREYRTQWDLSQNTRNSLSRASLDTLKQLQGPVTITAYATAQDPRLGDLRSLIRDFIAPYQRAKPDLELKFIDPAEQPKLASAAGVQVNGEMVVEFEKRSEHLTSLNEQALTNLLMRLARSRQRLVMYLDGHGERKLDGIANHDLGEFGKQLEAKGFKTGAVNLALAQEVPANASMLLIASPQVDLVKSETAKILAYLERGGNLLWVIDQEPLRGLQPLAEKLGLILTPGTVVDPDAQKLGGSATWALGAAYANHPITQRFNLNTVFPFARRIEVNEKSEWRATRLVEAAPRGWVETGKLDKTISFDKTRDFPGPVPIAVAMSRTLQEREQRIVVVGTGEFLANSFLGNAGNLDFGINVINWLAGDENLITIQPRATIDSNIALGKTTALILTLGFLIVLPLGFIATGSLIWWRKRKL